MTDTKVLISELAMITATLAQELSARQLLSPLAKQAIANALERTAQHLEVEDPTDPDDLTEAAAVVHSVSIRLRD